MNVIGIKVRDRDEGILVVESLETAIRNGRVDLDDIALVRRDEKGKLRIEQTKDMTPRKGARRGALVGALVGLAAPPLLGAAVVGGAIGTVWGKYRDRGLDDTMMRTVGEMLTGSEAIVFALGAPAAVDAVAARVAELTDGRMETFTIGDEDAEVVREAADELPDDAIDEGLLTDAAVDFPMPETMPTRYSV